MVVPSVPRSRFELRKKRGWRSANEPWRSTPRPFPRLLSLGTFGKNIDLPASKNMLRKKNWFGWCLHSKRHIYVSHFFFSPLFFLSHFLKFLENRLREPTKTKSQVTRQGVNLGTHLIRWQHRKSIENIWLSHIFFTWAVAKMTGCRRSRSFVAVFKDGMCTSSSMARQSVKHQLEWLMPLYITDLQVDSRLKSSCIEYCFYSITQSLRKKSSKKREKHTVSWLFFAFPLVESFRLYKFIAIHLVVTLICSIMIFMFLFSLFGWEFHDPKRLLTWDWAGAEAFRDSGRIHAAATSEWPCQLGSQGRDKKVVIGRPRQS